MAAQLFGNRNAELVHVLAGYEDGSVVFWQVANDKAEILWDAKEHADPGPSCHRISYLISLLTFLFSSPRSSYRYNNACMRYIHFCR